MPAPLVLEIPVDRDAATGHAVREALAGRCPWVAVQTSFSALHGTVHPKRWAAALAALAGGDPAAGGDRRGANQPAHGAAVARTARACAASLALATSPPDEAGPAGSAGPAEPAGPATGAPWALLADAGDLAGLPACLESWGRDHVAVGATLPLADRGHAASPVLLLATDAGQYRRLCRLLSFHHEAPEEWQAWLGGLTESGPVWEGLIALVQDAEWAKRLAWHGAEVLWRLPGPAAPAGIAAAAVPILTDIDGAGAATATLLHLIQDRSQVRAHIEAVRGRLGACTLAQLPRLMTGIADGAIALGHALAARCRFAPGQPGPDGQPRWQMPPQRWQDDASELRRRVREGLLQRYGDAAPRAVRERLEYELDVITRKNFARYILTVADIARDRRTCGRGSAASSLVCYLLGLTNVDPVKYRLVFERFLSIERTDPPDIDIDFPWDERDQVLSATIRDYGRDYVAMVATHQTLRSDGALREAGRVLGRTQAEISAAARRIDLAERFGAGPCAGAGWDEVLTAAQQLGGSLRGMGLHCGGIIITAEPIRDLVPVHPAAKTVDGRHLPAIAWEKDGAEAMGLIKIDLLGNRSLAVVRDVLNDLRDDGIAVDERRWAPDDDLLAVQLINRGCTIGCFYIESPAMRLLNGRAGEVDFDRLVLHSSIVRPAAYHWIGTYLERLWEHRRTGLQRDEWYPHPALRSLLSDSFGILSYQEDVMLAARDLAGFSIREQNTLRKALGRSDTPQRLATLAGAFHAGCARHGVSPEATATAWSMIISFAGYSFCKAHSASYAMVSFACACLKAHNPAHFLARVIHHGGGFYGICAYVEEARRLGVAILPPCVAQGFPDTRREGHKAIRLGLELVHGLHRRTQHAIIAKRQRMPFAGIRDLWCRCRPSAAELAALCDAGALDALARVPGQRDWIAAAVMHEPHGQIEEPDQLRFDFAPARSDDPVPPPHCPAPSRRDLDRRAWAVLGCLPRAHPFALWDLPERRLRCAGIGPQLHRRTVSLLVWVITHKQVEAVQERQRDGTPLPEPLVRPMAFVTLEDETGLLESTWFPESYQACGALTLAASPFWVHGRIMVEHGVATLEVSGARPLPPPRPER